MAKRRRKKNTTGSSGSDGRARKSRTRTFRSRPLFAPELYVYPILRSRRRRTLRTRPRRILRTRPRPVPLKGDRRRFGPEYPLQTDGSAASIVATPIVGRKDRHDTGRARRRSDGLSFSRPKRVLICQRRERRRRVAFAHGFAGRSGVGRGKPRHRDAFSDVGC